MTASRDGTTTAPSEPIDDLGRRIREMSEEPGSGVRMCHEQGKTAVYLSEDGQWLIEHESNGTIRRKPFVPVVQTRT